MLGCHEFCGYYEWTFHYVRRRWGPDAVARLWAEAIGGESQQHYAAAAQEAGLAGLYRTWVKTGQDEQCDWTFTLDESRNVLRWDMRNCPSKGFLLAHDMNADEDYCDHCMGWMIPLLDAAGVEVWQHEHNHRGQCWGTMRRTDRPSQPLAVEHDIRDDARWQTGYLDRWEQGRKRPLVAGPSACDSCQVLLEWFRPADRLVIVTAPPIGDNLPGCPAGTGWLFSDRAYAACGGRQAGPAAVLIGCDADLSALARLYLTAPEQRRPLLMHPYLPGRPAIDFPAHGLPRPLPLLPLLIRTGQYVHQPGGPLPDMPTLLAALARAIAKPIVP